MKRVPLENAWDLLVIGGGVTGAAVLLEAARRGLRALLVERGDFASGTSSRSSKLVHGGLRYLKEGKIGLTRESVREREELLRDAPGLVDPMWFLMPHYGGRKPSRATLAIGLAAYDLLAGRRQHRYLGRAEALALEPRLDPSGLTGAHLYLDASTDDARLVLRLLQAAQDAGASARNYVEVEGLLRSDGAVIGARLSDHATGESCEVSARVVINATGVSADGLRAEIGEAPKLRPLRGSHLLLHDWSVPVTQAVAFEHPADGRPVFAYPWLGMTLVGTTDLDHLTDLHDEPAISREEIAYLLDAIRYQFPSLRVGEREIVSTFAGVRPVIASGNADPSKESRDQVLLCEHGLVTITGGKLTTFRPMALAALAAAARHMGQRIDPKPRPVFVSAALPSAPGLSRSARQRLAGRYGARAQSVVDEAQPGELEAIGRTDVLWAELRWAARHENVVRLDDLLLRRTRLGLLFGDGATRFFPRLRETCADELGWNDTRWHSAEESYRELWQQHYGVPTA